MKIFVIEKERRKQRKKSRPVEGNRRLSNAVSKRYLMIVDDPRVEMAVKNELTGQENTIYPHESGDDFLFYCVAGRSGIDQDKFIKGLFAKLRKSAVSTLPLNQLEVHFCKSEDTNVNVICYKLAGDKVIRSVI